MAGGAPPFFFRFSSGAESPLEPPLEPPRFAAPGREPQHACIRLRAATSLISVRLPLLYAPKPPLAQHHTSPTPQCILAPPLCITSTA